MPYISAYTLSEIKTFLQAHMNDIVNAIAGTGLYFPSTVAQLSVESANGTSELSANYNNYGGVKGDPSAADSVAMNTTETNARVPTVAYFKTYPSFASFMQDYVNLLTTDSRYVNAGVFQATSPEQQIKLMVGAGYSTLTPSAYLSLVQGRINATRSLFPFGQIAATAGTNQNASACNVSGICCVIGGLQNFKFSLCSTPPSALPACCGN